MFQAIVKVNGEEFIGIGKTRQQAVTNATQTLSRTHTAGFAAITRPWVRVSHA